jgi:putative glutamine amidotransferase
MKPVIGITGSLLTRRKELQRSVPGSCPYVAAILAHGGSPLVFPTIADKDAILSVAKVCDGFLFAGGEDIDPARYNEEPDPALGTVDTIRDILEFTVFEFAASRKKPVLGICRGHQLINVGLGGSLIQDLPSAKYFHPSRDLSELVHDVILEHDSGLADLLGKQSIAVNSSHHQAVKECGKGLRVVARSPDGVVEAIEGTDDWFLVGVQCHPEATWSTSTPEFSGLFREFVRRC